MMIPRAVSPPRTLLAASAPSAIRKDSRIISSVRMASELLPLGRVAVGLLGLLLVVDLHQRSVLEVLRDRAVAARDDLIALLEPREDLDPVVALDPGLHLAGDGLAVFDHEHDLDEAVLVRLEACLGVLALLALAHELVHGAQRHALQGHAQ